MQVSDIPDKLPIPFAYAAGGGFIRPIPEASQIGVDDGAASLTDGFVPLNATPIASGGIPPNVKDINGILFEISGWSRWQAAGGSVIFDSGFASAIGGYPLGAALRSTADPAIFWVSTADNNSTDPDGGSPANWVAMSAAPASSAETAAGSITNKYVTPAGLAAQRATSGQLIAGTDAAKFATALSLAGLRASSVEIATGTDIAKYITPAGLLAQRATQSDVTVGTSIDKLVTPESLAGLFGVGSGYLEFAGKIIQWGRVAMPTNPGGSTVSGTFSLPTSFANSTFTIVGSGSGPGNGSRTMFNITIDPQTASSAAYIGDTGDNAFKVTLSVVLAWIAIGDAP